MDWVFGSLLTLLGISVIGLPAARFLQSRELPAIATGAVLIAVGVAGGGFVAVLYIFMLAVLSGGAIDVAQAGEVLAVAPFGFLPGAAVAAVWVALNSTSLSSSTKRNV
jgi:hypothetical protein